MKTAPINKLFRIIGGKPAPKGEGAFSDRGTPFIRMKDLGRAHFSNDLVDIEQRVSDEVAEKEGLNLVRKGAILLPRSGSVALNHRAVLGVDAYMVSHICALEVLDPAEINNIYAYYYLRSIKMDRISKKTTGLDAITFEDLGKLSIPVPQLDDQVRIAHLLSKVDKLIGQRRQNLEQIEDLLRSVFIHFFGDPVRNENGWDRPELKEFGKISTGNTPPRNEPENYNNDFIEWIKTDNITGNAVFVTPSTEHLSEVGARRARTVTKGALLVACIAGSVESIGRSALTNRTVSFNQQINAIQPAKDVNPLYLYSLFKLCRTYIQRHATKGMKKILTKGDFEKIEMIKPPLEIQNRFAAVAEKIEQVKSRYLKSLADLETLFDALSHQAFRGELDLSRVPMPGVIPETGTGMEEAPLHTLVEHDTSISLPDIDTPPDALNNTEARRMLITEWLEAYRAQLGSAPFSVQRFMKAAQNRLSELRPDNDFELNVNEYENVKTWVFEALASGRLQQSQNVTGKKETGEAIFGNLIELKVAGT
ncbi:restriction endonuclease subunit S [Agrobacterium cavarae]|uniref:restriction endonuclease subunit S n=1 Tax=Agrobacterium cavarae TaxID=2528239 RepID=UPI0028B0A085|nr:restriction endonuclease subunit S [Agrobacterium cavarae]